MELTQLEKAVALVVERTCDRISKFGRTELNEDQIVSTTQIELERLRGEIMNAARVDVRARVVQWYSERGPELRPENPEVAPAAPPDPAPEA